MRNFRVGSVLIAIGSLAIFSVGCGEPHGEQLDRAQLPFLVTWYGSDEMRRAIKAEEWRIGSGLDFMGQGDAVGQSALAAGSQCLAPMSRDFTSCHSGAKTFPVALDGIAVYVANGAASALPNPATQVTFKVLKRLFSGNGNAVGCAQYRWSDATSDIGDLTTAAAPFSGKNIKLYRLDDASGTTDVFKSKLGMTAFCASPTVDITVVRDDNVGCSGVSGPCVTCSALSATDCMPQLVGTNAFALGIAALGASTEPSFGGALKKLNVSAEMTNTTGGTYHAPTAANIRKLLPLPSTAYPLSRPVFINRDVNNACTGSEVAFKNASLGIEKCAFENTLVTHGFVACLAGNPRTDPDADCLSCPGLTYACP
jgi:phosphate transport system substrate-binding protein